MPLRPYQDYRRYVGPERPPRPADHDTPPAWAPPRWTLGVFWRWWTADPARILANYALSIVLIVVWWTLVIVLDGPESWIVTGAFFTAFAGLPVALFGPRVWREHRRRRAG